MADRRGTRGTSPPQVFETQGAVGGSRRPARLHEINRAKSFRKVQGAAAEQVVERVEERMAAPRERGFRARFAGREFQPGMERDFALGFLSQFGQRMGASPMGRTAMGASPVGAASMSAASTGASPMGATAMGVAPMGAHLSGQGPA